MCYGQVEDIWVVEATKRAIRGNGQAYLQIFPLKSELQALCHGIEYVDMIEM